MEGPHIGIPRYCNVALFALICLIAVAVLAALALAPKVTVLTVGCFIGDSPNFIDIYVGVLSIQQISNSSMLKWIMTKKPSTCFLIISYFIHSFLMVCFATRISAGCPQNSLM